MRLAKTRVPFRFGALLTYWAWLTGELLVSDPWVLLGEKLARNPPIDTHNMWVSFTIHFGAFSVLGFLLTWATEKFRNSVLYSWFTAAFVYAGVTEILQLWVPKRWPSAGDALCNMLGVGLGLWSYKRLSARIRRTPSVPASAAGEPSVDPVQKAA